MTDIPPLIAAMRDTLNRGDATGYLALFARDADTGEGTTKEGTRSPADRAS